MELNRSCQENGEISTVINAFSPDHNAGKITPQSTVRVLWC